MVKDTDIQWALTTPTGNDHRQGFMVHLWDKGTKSSKLVMFYAYYRKDVVAIVREYAVRFGNYSIIDVRLGR